MFYVGQKVVCIRASFSGLRRVTLHDLVERQIYTVRDTFLATDGTPCVRLQEICNPRRFNRRRAAMWEPGYKTERFRPVVERKTDISIFKAMLNPSDERVTA